LKKEAKPAANGAAEDALLALPPLPEEEDGEACRASGRGRGGTFEFCALLPSLLALAGRDEYVLPFP
jgi:hypothetical protein